MATSLWRPLGAATCRPQPSGSLQSSRIASTFCGWPSFKSIISSRRGAVRRLNCDSQTPALNPSSDQQQEGLRDGGGNFVAGAPQKLFTLEYDYVSDYITRREKHRQAHFQLLSKYVDQGKILLAGPHSPPLKALIIFQVDTLEEVEFFVSQDPYAQNGIVARSSASEWHVFAGAWKDH